MKNEIRVFIKQPGSAFYEAYIENELEAFQAAVGGYIEFVPIGSPSNRDIGILADEEGIIKGREYNCDICGIRLFGTIVLVGVKGEDFADFPFDIDFLQRITNMED